MLIVIVCSFPIKGALSKNFDKIFFELPFRISHKIFEISKDSNEFPCRQIAPREHKESQKRHMKSTKRHK